MCLSPLTLRTNRNGKSFNDVPCGKCDSCRNQKVDDYVARSYFDYINNNKNAYFATLTYDNHNLPLVEYIDKLEVSSSPFDVSPDERDEYTSSSFYKSTYIQNLYAFQTKSISCWNKLHVQKFLKTLNEKVQYNVITSHYGIPKYKHGYLNPDYRNKRIELGRPFRYLLTSERGKSDIYQFHGRSRRGTSRPHYHLILILTNNYSSTNLDILQLIKENWLYGLSYNVHIDRTVPQSINYVCKYVVKDKNELILKKPLVYPSESYKQPFTLISNNYGSSLFNYISDVNSFFHYLVNGIQIPTKDNQVRNINLPLYYSKKLLYDKVHLVPSDLHDSFYVKSTIFVRYFDGKSWVKEYSFIGDDSVQHIDTLELNTLGLEIKSLQHQRFVKYQFNLYNKFKNFIYLYPKIPSYLFNLINDDDYYYFLEQEYNIVKHSPSFNDSKLPTYNLINDFFSQFKTFSEFHNSNLYDNHIINFDKLEFALTEHGHLSKYFICYSIFQYIRKYSNLDTKLKLYSRNLHYRNNLPKALENSPNLFNRVPL